MSLLRLPMDELEASLRTDQGVWRRPPRYAPQEARYGRAIAALIPPTEDLLTIAARNRWEQLTRTDQETGDPQLDDILRAQLRAFMQRATRFEPVQQAHYEELQTLSAQDFRRRWRQFTGVDPFEGDEGLRLLLARQVRDDAARIESWGSLYYEQVADTMEEGLFNGWTLERLTRELVERHNVWESRAKFVARDAGATFIGHLDRARQTRNGVTEYIWRTAEDERVRATHRELDRTVQRWDSPPAVGSPGEDYNCRCWPEPIIEDPEPAPEEP